MTISSDIRFVRPIYYAYLMHNSVNVLRYGRGESELEARRARLVQAEGLYGELGDWIERERKEIGA